MKTCNQASCEDIQVYYDLINQSGLEVCESGIFVPKNGCIRAECIHCAFSLNQIRNSFFTIPYQRIGCGYHSDETSLWTFLYSNLDSEYEERLRLCLEGRIGLCKEAEPIAERDFRMIAGQAGFSCKSMPSKPKIQNQGAK